MATHNVVTPESNLITTTEMSAVTAREIEFTLMFEENLNQLMNALGVVRKIPAAAGTILKSKYVTGSLASGGGVVPEGEVIPLSKYEVKEKSWGEMAIKKWRKATTAEAILKSGYDAAVQMTTDKMLKQVQNEIRTAFFAYLADATGKGTASGAGLQAALADGWGKLQTIFEDNAVDTVYFVNPQDVAAYLGTAQISTQTAFGMSYIENFLGLGTVIMSSAVTKGKFYATAKDNIVLYYVPANESDMAKAFSFTTDATGLIGIHEESDYTNMTASDTVISGINLFAENASGVIVGTITAASAS